MVNLFKMVIIQITFLALAGIFCKESRAQNIFVRTLVPVSPTEKCPSKSSSSCCSCSSTFDDLSSLLLLAKTLNERPAPTHTCNELKADEIVSQLIDALVYTTTKTVAAANQNQKCEQMLPPTTTPVTTGGRNNNDLILGLLNSGLEGLVPQLLGLLLGSPSSGGLLNLSGSKDLPIMCINGHKMLYLGQDTGGSCVSGTGVSAIEASGKDEGILADLLKSL